MSSSHLMDTFGSLLLRNQTNSFLGSPDSMIHSIGLRVERCYMVERRRSCHEVVINVSCESGFDYYKLCSVLT